MDDGVRAANRLTARWAATVGAGSTVLSGAGAWPLLALLAAAADGPARAELAAAVDLPADGADRAATALLAAMDRAVAVRTALGLWSTADLPLTDWWRATVPDRVRGLLTGDQALDQATLDSWAKEQTAGQVETMPVTVDASTLLVLATALSVRTDWAHPFHDVPLGIGPGPWAGRRVAGLVRSGPGVDALTVADTAAGPVTSLTVRGTADVDVNLVLGEPDRAAGAVLAAGVGAAAGRRPQWTGADLPLGPAAPGVVVEEVPSTDPTPKLTVATVRFAVRASHDLLAHPDVFGLATAADASRGHFPGISSRPLAVSQARQAAVAEFTAEGFRAAAVTAVAMAPGSAPPRPTATARLVRVTFDRPFGFVAVHRPTGLVLVAGWVAEPG